MEKRRAFAEHDFVNFDTFDIGFDLFELPTTAWSAAGSTKNSSRWKLVVVINGRFKEFKRLEASLWGHI